MAISFDNLHASTAFAEVASDFCACIDGLSNGQTSGIYKRLEGLLAHLHQAILPVAQDIAGRDVSRKGARMTTEQYREIAEVISKALAPQVDVLVARHVELAGTKGELDEDAIRASMVCDDLADIY